MLGILDSNVSLSRAGAVAQYVRGVVLFCGGQSQGKKGHSDCLMYNPMQDEWRNFSVMKKAHDEAAMTNAANVTYVIGGVGERSVEFIDMKKFEVYRTRAKNSRAYSKLKRFLDTLIFEHFRKMLIFGPCLFKSYNSFEALFFKIYLIFWPISMYSRYVYIYI